MSTLAFRELFRKLFIRGDSDPFPEMVPAFSLAPSEYQSAGIHYHGSINLLGVASLLSTLRLILFNNHLTFLEGA